ncbi:MAG: hypothetical protein M1814_006850 [Vezdaea aestivalis]|nr:MAG: hypothetical protein M1814_006850 [Vezdaea aestivalis]
MDFNFISGFHASTDGDYLTYNIPSTEQASTGALKWPYQKRKYRQNEIDTRATLGVNIVLRDPKDGKKVLDTWVEEGFDSYWALESFGQNKDYSITMGGSSPSTSVLFMPGLEKFENWRDQSKESKLVGSSPGARQIASGAPGGDREGGGSGPSGHPVATDPSALFGGQKDLLQCAGDEFKTTCDFDLCQVDPESRETDDGENEDEGELKKRMLRLREENSTPEYAQHLDRRLQSAPDDQASPVLSSEDPHLLPISDLEKRNKKGLKFICKINGQDVEIKWDTAPYPSFGTLRNFLGRGGRFPNGVFETANPSDCANTKIALNPTAPGVNRRFATEHLLEINAVRQFLDDYVNTRRTPTDRQMPRLLDCRWFRDNWNNDSTLNDPPALPGRHDLVTPAKFKQAVDRAVSGDARRMLVFLRNPIIVFEYLNDAGNRIRMGNIRNAIAAQFQLIDQQLVAQGIANAYLADSWNMWIDDHFVAMTRDAMAWLRNGIAQARARFSNNNRDIPPDVAGWLRSLEGNLTKVRYDRPKKMFIF